MINVEGALIPSHSIASLVATYHDAQSKIREACAEIARQQSRIREAFGAWLRRRGMENEAGARQRFAGRSKNKGTK